MSIDSHPRPGAAPAKDLEAQAGEPAAPASRSRSGGETSEQDEGDPNAMRYTILDVPPWYECVLLGFQNYLTMLGSTVLIPFLVVLPMGGTPEDLGHVIGTIFFISGVITLLQTLLGDRLPIIQGGSFAYLTPVAAITLQIKARGGWEDAPDGTNHERFLVTMREVSGAIIGSALFIVFLGASGIISAVLKYISPLTVAANIAIVGLALYDTGVSGVGVGSLVTSSCRASHAWFENALQDRKAHIAVLGSYACPALGVPMMCVVMLFALYLRKISLPLGRLGRLHLFELFPVLLAIALVWTYGAILTAAGVWNGVDPALAKACRTDDHTALDDSAWFRFPYPGQWGAPTFSWGSVITMLAGALSAMVESLGDYYAAAKICGAPVPPPSLIGRAVTVQGISCVLTGAWGTGNGTTAYNENIGALQITRTGSRRVIQVGAVIIIIVALNGKFGGLFASLPNALVSGLFCIVFGIIAAVGISQLQYADMNSPRNLFIFGFALYMGLSVPAWITSYTKDNGRGPIATGSQPFNDICNSLLNTGPAVALLITLVLDNTVPGSFRERGLHVWQSGDSAREAWWEDDTFNKVYGWPLNGTRRYEAFMQPHRERLWRLLGPCAGRLRPCLRRRGGGPGGESASTRALMRARDASSRGHTTLGINAEGPVGAAEGAK